jgi:pyruvate ferredoxin oxidoreductase delta subunit
MSKLPPANQSWKEIWEASTIPNAGNADELITGDWRSIRPKMIWDKCKQCALCIPVCPDSSIPVDPNTGNREEFDFNHCKGCGVCAKVCPFAAIEMEDE